MIQPYYEEPGITIYHGDCQIWLPQLQRRSVDLILTSPPYDDLRSYGGGQFDFHDTAPWIVRCLKEGSVLVWIVDDQKRAGSESGTRFSQVLTFMRLGLHLHDTMIYEAVNGAHGAHNEYLQCFEMMYVLSYGVPQTVHLINDRRNTGHSRKMTTKPRTPDGNARVCPSPPQKAFGRRTNIWRYQSGTRVNATGHPASFPLALAKDHIYSWTDPGMTVIDPFMGSGTTLIAAKALGRQAIGIEIEERYCEVAVNRLRQEVLALGDD